MKTNVQEIHKSYTVQPRHLCLNSFLYTYCINFWIFFSSFYHNHASDSRLSYNLTTSQLNEGMILVQHIAILRCKSYCKMSLFLFTLSTYCIYTYTCTVHISVFDIACSAVKLACLHNWKVFFFYIKWNYKLCDTCGIYKWNAINCHWLHSSHCMLRRATIYLLWISHRVSTKRGQSPQYIAFILIFIGLIKDHFW